ncbi:MAG: hypothetical protein JJT96_15940 [Opitutales bacterium]|nr:hypothetical protein [Opitutales bacterium]
MSAVYLILGAGDSGRADLIAQLVRTGLSPDDGPFGVYHSVADAAASPDAYAALARLPSTSVALLPEDWPSGDTTPPILAGAATLVLSLDGHGDPLDQIEAAKDWIVGEGHTLARIITVIDCALAQRAPKSLPWFEACIHFSDVVLLGNRSDDAKKWIHDYEKTLHRKALPALIRLLKKGGRVDGWDEVLFPEARRLSLYFDPPEEITVDSVMEEGATLEDELPSKDAPEPLPGDAESDLYLQRLDSGQRRLRLPNIRELLSP